MNRYGDFSYICKTGSLPVCNYFRTSIVPTCTLNTIGSGSVQIVDLGNFSVTIIAILLIFVLMIKSYNKTAAVGRKEVSLFLASAMLANIASLFSFTLKFGNNGVEKWLNVFNTAALAMTFWALLYFGFVGFQLIPDGSIMSMFLMALTMLVVFIASGFLAADVTFNITKALQITTKYPSVSQTLFSIVFIFSAVCVICFVLCQFIIVFRFLAGRKPLLWLVCAGLSLVLGVALNIFLSSTICKSTSNAINSSMFATFLYSIAVFFVYRFWYTITEDEADDFAGMYKF
ncbi:hypothetical protein BB559_003326 [Furculomyces boomerangus]|uniref:Uncharacterized protein n=2 Tax=Harpellales TaxID=61421 RepID=A0A2T9YLX0_9FUNG|nr:hypothetical protein BB559_005042 [Furculomyces boomerangus]PVU93336.1 hypothetical protein BB559_003326 [Furculomyces boomerangus]PWA01561.1 hypothetical protein BB558_002343 [Smittium angustum]